MVSVLIREVHKAPVPGNPHYIASVQIMDEEDNWISPVFPIDFHDNKELERKILQEITLYITAKKNWNKFIARGGMK